MRTATEKRQVCPAIPVAVKNERRQITEMLCQTANLRFPVTVLPNQTPGQPTSLRFKLRAENFFNPLIAGPHLEIEFRRGA